MSKTPSVTRPPFEQAMTSWTEFLKQRGLPTDLTWVFDENLCFERDAARPSGFRLGFQTTITPPPPGAERIAYEHFLEFAAPLVFYRIGSCRNRSLCLLLCDAWFKGKGEPEGFWSRPEWGLLFHPGEVTEIEEVTDKERWQQRIIRDRPLHDLDFCMALRGVHEILAHGRVLSTYERYALKFLHIWRHIFEGRPH